MKEFLTWCDGRAAACRSNARALAADHRGDEARFEQIRANVYGIFRAVYATLSGDALEKQVRAIPQAWEKSLALAREHGDTEQAMIEQLKLDTAAQILQEAPHD